MQAIRSSNSQIEQLLGRALWRRGFRYRKNDTSVFGKPDFTMKWYQLAIFVDSEFWHGKDWKNLQMQFKTNRTFWIEKIERNMRRDRLVNLTLKREGWTVLRFWGHDIKTDLRSCVLIVEEAALTHKTVVNSSR